VVEEEEKGEPVDLFEQKREKASSSFKKRTTLIIKD